MFFLESKFRLNLHADNYIVRSFHSLNANVTLKEKQTISDFDFCFSNENYPVAPRQLHFCFIHFIFLLTNKIYHIKTVF